MPEACVIGAGFGGISAALRLKAKGYSVTIIDRCSQLGGRAQVFERDGYKFDAGPTVVTAPFLFDELYKLFNKKREDYIEFVPVDPWYRFIYPDGDYFDYGGTVDETLKEIERIHPPDRENYLKLLKKSKQIFDVGFTQLADEPFHKLTSMLKQVPNLLKLNSFKTVWGLVSGCLKHEKLRQAFSIQPLLVGGNPFDTTCIYNLIHYLEREWGIHFATGGTGAIVAGLEKLMIEEGVNIKLNETITKINCSENLITSITSDSGNEYTPDVVVSNADPTYLYGSMIPKKAQSFGAKVKSKYSKLSMGLFVLYFGTNKTYPDVVHHTIWMGKRYKPLLKDIFHNKILADDFSLYVHRPTATDSSFAPAGCDSFYVLSPVPNLQANVDWDVEGERYAEKIITALEKTMLPGLREFIQVQFHMTPKDFSNDYLSNYGTGFSIAPTLTQSAWFRFHNKAEGPENLYLVGAGTHPGAGLPGVISSAKVVEKLVPAV
jgi:phytoene desaturase